MNNVKTELDLFMDFVEGSKLEYQRAGVFTHSRRLGEGFIEIMIFSKGGADGCREPYRVRFTKKGNCISLQTV